MVCLGPRFGKVIFNVNNVMGCYCDKKGWFYGFSMQQGFHQVYKWWSRRPGTKLVLFRWLSPHFVFLMLLSNVNVVGISNSCVYSDCVSKSRFRLVLVYLHWPIHSQFESALFVMARGAISLVFKGCGNDCCQRKNIDKVSPSSWPSKRSF